MLWHVTVLKTPITLRNYFYHSLSGNLKDFSSDLYVLIIVNTCKWGKRSLSSHSNRILNLCQHTMLKHRMQTTVCFIILDVKEDYTVLLTLSDTLSLYLEKCTLLILHCCGCPALVKTSLCQGLRKELQNDRSGCLSWWSPRKNGTDRKFMTLNYIKVTSVNIMSKELFILRVFLNYINTFYELSVMKNFSWYDHPVWSSKCSKNIV